LGSEFVPIICADDTPLDSEVRYQLERMLATPRFRNAGKQSPFLKLVVERALRRQKTPGRFIAKELFPDKVEVDTVHNRIRVPAYCNDVRVTANNLRTTLKKYQAKEGREDLVIISLPDPPEDKSVKLPEGEAYMPRFLYNPNHAVSNEVRLGEYHLTRATYEDLQRAIEYFSKALEISPGHIRAQVGIAEALCTSLGWTAKEISASDLNKILNKVAEILDHVMEEASGYWRVHAAAGMFLVAVSDMTEAKKNFDAALALDRSMTEAYPAYLGYLIATGKPTKAVELARLYLNLNIANVGAYATCALTMAMAKNIPEAAEMISRALKLDRGHPGVRMLASVFKLAEAPASEGQEFSQLATILDDVSYGLLKRELLGRGGLVPDPES
jgi:tetratricopeptide (TPR) repeat protein